MKEELVTFEQARLLKECGFDWECGHYYTKENAADDEMWLTTSGVANWNADDAIPFGKPICSAPTQALAQKWLRDEKGIDIIIALFRNIDARVEPPKITREYEVEICIGEDDECADEYFPTYESALSAGLDAALEFIKQK